MDYPEKIEKVMEGLRVKAGSDKLGLFVDLGSILSITIPYPADGDHWGKWRFDAKRLDLVFEEGGRDQYTVDLKEMDSSAEMLDWIFQIDMKGWATREDIGNLIKALDDLFRPQSTLCSEGADKRINAKEYLRKKLESGRAD